MSQPSSPVDICNLALDELKHAPIMSIDTPESTAEKICARWYDATRRECLRKHPWKFATKRATLTPSGTDPDFGYTSAYNLPNDYIRLVSIGDDSEGSFLDRYQIENGQILTSEGTDDDGTSLNVRYVYNIEDVSRFDPLFLKFFVFQLALNMSPKFSLAANAKQLLKQDYEDVSSEARAVNGQDRRPQRIQRSRHLERRRAITNGGFASDRTVFS